MKKRSLRRILIFLFSASFLFMQTLSASAQANADSVIQDNSFQDGSNASVIDNLITAQMEALVSGNMIEYDRIGELLDNCGARITTPEELAELTGGEIPELASSSYGVHPLSSSSSTIRTEYCEYTQNGQTYDAMKIYATPANSSSVLYKTGNTIVKNSKSATAIAMKFIQVGVTAVSSAFSTNTVSRILKSVIPTEYNSVAKAFYMYQNGGLHEAFVNKVNITGIEGKTVNTITLYNPEIPAMIS